MKPKDQWLIAKMKPETRYLSGFVINVGTALKGDKPKFKRGDRILYRVDADWKQRIEGIDYFTIRQRHIMAFEVVDKKNVATLANSNAPT
jgi:co-chaperonin GroES (HSP10)